MIHFPKSPSFKGSHLPAPSSFRSPSPRFSKSVLTKRYCRLLFAALFALSFFAFFFHAGPPPPPSLYRENTATQGDLVLLPPSYSPPPNNGLPPLFEAWKDYERNLSQHAQDDPTIKFIYMKNHAWGMYYLSISAFNDLIFFQARVGVTSCKKCCSIPTLLTFLVVPLFSTIILGTVRPQNTPHSMARKSLLVCLCPLCWQVRV